MKTNKMIKWLYGLFMLVPFLAIGVRCLYVSFNKNAYQSYSDTYITQIDKIEGALTDGVTYYVETSKIENAVNGPRVNYSSISIDWTDYGAPQRDYIGFYVYGTGSILLYYDGGNQGLGNAIWNDIDNFTVTVSGTANTLANSFLNFYLITQKQHSLDNAFYYSINEFNNVGFNQLDFVSWFSFLYENTNIFTTFLNCYINYMLFVSVAFFIPRVLYWFVNYAYSLTEAFSSKSNGGGW